MIPLIISVIEDPDDRDFMENLYFSYNRLIYSEICKFIKDRWDIEDVMQTVLLKLIDKIQLLRSFDRNQRINYIIVSSRNTALNFIRDSKRDRQVSYDEEIDWLEDNFPSPENRLEQVERVEDIGRAWKLLDDRSRRILEMKYFLEKSDEEIAREVGVSANSLRMLLTRARRKLKGYMVSQEET